MTLFGRRWEIKRSITAVSISSYTLLVLASTAEVSFNNEIRPLLASKCYDCHGPDAESRKAKLRLDKREDAKHVLQKDGKVLARITSTDPDEIMPPPESHRTLEPDEVALLRQWIDEGAPYESHWAFDPPTRPQVPTFGGDEWTINPIDHFILHRLQEEKLAPSPEADRYTLVRRVYLDLIGLPPTPEQADVFVKNNDPRAYETLVDKLLKSEHYGERWARQWLDLARYSDTNGYEKDRPRSIWPYRDWVVKALNEDMPFDQFSIEQLAGDMLPNATIDQRIATGFHRNTMLNEEGGIDPLEYRYYAMVDRVATTGTIWMGLSTGCAQCHTHKYDPIEHTDYFQLMALLNNADEPDLEVPDDRILAQKQVIEQEIATLEAEAMAKIDEQAFAEWQEEQQAQAAPWTSVTPNKATSNLPRLAIEEDGTVFASGDFTKRDVYKLRYPLETAEETSQGITAIRLEVLPDKRLPAHGPGICYYEGRRGDFFLSELDVRVNGKKVAFSGGSKSFGKISIGSGSSEVANLYDGDGSTGWSTATREGEAHHLVLNLAEPIATPAEMEIEMLFERHFAAALGRFRIDVTRSEKKAVAFESDAPDPLTASTDEMKRYYVHTHESFADDQKKLKELRKRNPNMPTTLVMREREADNPRTTHRHHRGEYLSPRETVQPAVPAVFPQLPEDEAPNRLALARWLVSDRNPLVARVTVNRAWQALFGTGLVESSDDFGTQAPAPSHAKLLDWLACEFVDQGWSMKSLHRLLVTSATYKQTSAVSPELLAKDSQNRLLARGPQFRLNAEAIRDTALAASGLLSKKKGGPGVYPPQPASVTALAYGNTAWKASSGDERFRRSLYTFSKRTAPFAAYTVFDGPTGESCVARRSRSNTPLQALTLLNDAMYLEMAEALAQRAIAQADSERERINHIFRSCVTRLPTEEEAVSLTHYYQEQHDRFKNGELKAEELLTGDEPTAEGAAWTLLARVVLNLDETITNH